MTTPLTVTASHDFRPDAIDVVDPLTFATSEANPMASFNGSQLSTAVHINGDGHFDFLTVYLTTESDFAADGWSFATWSGLVTIHGHAGANSITGSSSYNSIWTSGALILKGGDSGNGFVYQVAADIVPGQSVIGGAGTDNIGVAGAGTFDFSAASLSSIEQLAIFHFTTSATRVILTASQIAGITNVDATDSTGDHPFTLVVNGAAANLAGVSFDNWFVGPNRVVINGTAGNNLLIGSIENDWISGAGGNDVLIGAANNDVLIGGIGRDGLAGGDGNDSLRGGPGGDRFRFDTALSAATNVDSVADFWHLHDKVHLKHAVFNHLALGALHAAVFQLGTHAFGPEDRIIYDRSHGRLYYDQDGTGAHAKVLFAILANHAALSSADLVVVA